jgi:hypothetical protein
MMRKINENQEIAPKPSRANWKNSLIETN